MEQDQPPKKADEKSTDRPPEAQPIRTDITKQLPETSVPPSQPPQQLRGDEGTEENKPQKNCADGISVKIVKDDAMSTFESRSFVLSIITLAVLIVTFVVFALQLKESKKQTCIFKDQVNQATLDAKSARDQLTEQFRIDQKPVVWLSNNQDISKLFEIARIVASGPAYVLSSWHYSNFGKSAAYIFKGSVTMLVGRHADKRITPEPLRDFIEILPPGKEDWITIASKPLHEPVQQAALQQDGWVAAIVRFEYKDSSGHAYESIMGQSHLQQGPWMFMSQSAIRDCSIEHCD